MCLIKSVPDKEGDFIAPARVFQPKSTSNRSSYFSQASSSRHYATAEHSPRNSNPYGVPPPPTAASRSRSLRRAGLAVPPPLVVQEVAPRLAPYTVPPPQLRPAQLAIPPQNPPYVMPALQPQAFTQIREPSRQPTTRSVIPPPVPDAPPAARDSRHSRDASRSSHSTRGRPDSRQSSAPRSPRSPHQLSPRAPRRHPSTSTRSRRSDDLASTSSIRSDRASVGRDIEPRRDRLSVELPIRSALRPGDRYLEQPKQRESIVFQNKDGKRVKQFYYD